MTTTTLDVPLSRDQSATLLGQTMAPVAATAAFFAVGAYLGRDMSYQWGWLWFIAAFACLIGMNVVTQRSEGIAVAMLFGFGLLIGLAVAPTLSYYAGTDPKTVWEAGAATALFVAGFGTAGYATRRDLSTMARGFFWALVALLGFGVVLIFVEIPNGSLIYAIGWARDLRGIDRVRLPTPAPQPGHSYGAVARRIDLPRRAERLPLLPVDLQRQPRLARESSA